MRSTDTPADPTTEPPSAPQPVPVTDDVTDHVTDDLSGTTQDTPRRYEASHAWHTRTHQQLQDLDRTIGWVRLLTFGVLLYGGWRLYQDAAHAWSWLVLGGSSFSGLVLWHDQVLRRRNDAATRVRYFAEGLERIAGRYPPVAEDGARFAAAHHPYAHDLDVVGENGMFARLCVAQTEAGQRMLAQWLLSPTTWQAACARQAAVQHLMARPKLREDIFVVTTSQGARRSAPISIAQWAQEPARAPRRGVTWALGVLSGLTLTSMLGAGQGWIPAGFFWLSLLLLWGAAFFYRARVAQIIHEAESLAGELGALSRLSARLEHETWEDPYLRELTAGLRLGVDEASKAIARLHRTLQLLDSRRNILFAPLAALLLWGTQIAFRVDRLRVRARAHIPGWLNALAAFDALSSLATYADEHPHDSFPHLEEPETCYRAMGLGHPLLNESTCVRNDVDLSSSCPLWIVSGSNMSGKSTWMRTVGLNAVLAYAGAPVRAEQMSISVMQIGATLRIQDSLHEGASRFYAELSRIQELMVASQDPPPLLFFFDELLSGTNSHDRALGAEAILRKFLASGAIGLMTTHDLALTTMAERFDPPARNVHLEDALEDGKLVFDYRWKDGVSTTSNAIAWMQSLGMIDRL